MKTSTFKIVTVLIILVLAGLTFYAIASFSGNVWHASYAKPQETFTVSPVGDELSDGRVSSELTLPVATVSTGEANLAVKTKPKLQSSLGELVALQSSMGSAAAAEFASRHGLDFKDDRVTVVLEASTGAAAATEAALAAGGLVEATYKELVQVSVPVEKIEKLAESAAVAYVREPEKPVVFATTDEGVADIGASAWQNSGDTGAGVKMAIIDPGFAGYDQRVAEGDLPSTVTVRSFRADGDITGGGLDHGTACAEIAYDVAPGAQLYLVNFSTDVELGNAVNWLISQNVNIVSGSFGFFSSFQGNGQGAIDDITQTAQQAGIFWANSAGNAAQTHWSGAFTDTNLNGWTEFSSDSETNSFTALEGQPVSVYLTWDKWPVTDQDYDLYLYWNGQLVASSLNAQTGTQPPAEEINYIVPPGRGGTYSVKIKNFSANGVATFSLYTYPYPLQFQTPEGSLGGQPSDSPYVMTVGAVPVYGTTLEVFSSQGPTADGRIKPDIVAPDRVSTATYGPQGFWGTSASAPHVAGAGALVKSANPLFTPQDVQSFLEGRATDLGAVGKDNLYGSGKLYLGSAPPPPNGPSYYFTWYDEATAGMSDWILIANTSDTLAVAEVFVGGQLTGTYQIPGGSRVTPHFPGLMNGPVQVLSAGGQVLLVSQRVLYNGNFTELAAVPGGSLATEHYLTWYDEQTPGMLTWLLVGNQGTQPTTAEIYIHGVLQGSYVIQPGSRVTPRFSGVMDGPVYVRSLDGQPLVVSERVLYQGSFNEVMSIPASALAGEYNFTWYDSNIMNTWVLVANPGAATVTAEIYIGGQLRGSYGIPGGGRVTPIYPGLMTGPVKVKSVGGEQLIVSERSLMGNSFEEVQGTPPAALASTQWFTWYDQLTPGMLTWILISNQGTSDTTASIYIRGQLKGTYSLPVGSTKTFTYPGVMDGPVEVVGGGLQPLMVSERTLYNSSFNELVGIVP